MMELTEEQIEKARKDKPKYLIFAGNLIQIKNPELVSMPHLKWMCDAISYNEDLHESLFKTHKELLPVTCYTMQGKLQAFVIQDLYQRFDGAMYIDLISIGKPQHILNQNENQ